MHDIELRKTVNDPADDVELADTVGLALHVVLDRLSPRERVAFVLHDSFGFEFPTIASILDTTPSAARKLASRARAHVSQPHPEDGAQVEVTGTLERMATSTSPAVPTSGKLHFTAYGVPADVSVNGAGAFGLLLPSGNYLISGTGTSAAGHGLCHVRQKFVVTPFEPLRVRVACA